jgi:hypothetical protein
MFNRRRPLLRAAAVSGGAYLMGKRHSENQQPQAEQDQRRTPVESQPPAAPATAGISSDAVARLQELGKLHEQGVLTDQEFATQKELLLAG